MNDQDRAQLIALLYGELHGAEAEALRGRIAADAELRAEWEELNGARTLLTGWEVEESAPRVVFVERAPKRRRSWFRVPAAATWGLAAAAVLLISFGAAGLRVERLPSGVAFSLGRTRSISDRGDQAAGGPGGSGNVNASGTVNLGSRQNPAGSVALNPATLLDNAGSTALVPSADGAGAIRKVSGEAGNSPYMTKAEFDGYAQALGRTMLGLLTEYAARRDQETADFLRAAVTGLNTNQERNYDALRGQIQTLSIGVAEDQVRTKAQVDYLWHERRAGEPDTLQPATETSR